VEAFHERNLCESWLIGSHSLFSILLLARTPDDGRVFSPMEIFLLHSELGD
jgi:hypothetical protein